MGRRAARAPFFALYDDCRAAQPYRAWARVSYPHGDLAVGEVEFTL